MADTGHTSVHLTIVTDTRLTELVNRFGRNHAQAVWDAGLAAIATIDDVVREQKIDAGFEWLDGYLHAPLNEATSQEAERLQEDATIARDLGFDAEYVETVPQVNGLGIRFADQARIHPRSYLAGVAKAFVALGGRIYEHSAADEFCDDPQAVKVAGHTVRCEDVVIATHNPLVGLAGLAGATLFQTKLALYTSYVVAGRAPKGVISDALWWDTSDPYHYLRVEPHRDFDVVIFGGDDHKTGQQDNTAGCYRRLEERIRAIVPQVELTHRWSGQVIETPDGLPYIGRSAEHQYSATGYAGNGLPFGTLGGMMISDGILERSNPWAELFDPSRKALTRRLWDYLKENVDYPYYMIRDRFAGPDAQSLRAVGVGKARSSSGMAPESPRTGIQVERSRSALPSAPTWGARWAGTPPNGHGTVPVMGRGSSRSATLSPDRPKRRSPGWTEPSEGPDVNAVIGGYLRDLAFTQSSQQKMFGYKRAAAAIVALEAPLTDLLGPDGALPRIPGIGPSSTRIIREILDTGGSPTVERAIEESDRRADIERRRQLRRHFLSRAEVRRILADPSFEGPTIEQYRGDLQMHSEWSEGNPTVQDIADACRERGYQFAAVTDHSYGLKIAVRPDLDASVEKPWLDALFAMRYDNPAHREMMDPEGLKAWLPGRTTGFGPLTAAVETERFFAPASS